MAYATWHTKRYATWQMRCSPKPEILMVLFNTAGLITPLLPKGVVTNMRKALGGFPWRRLPKPSPAMAVALLALVIAASGAAVAAIPSNGTINGCYSTKTGALRVIDSGQSCSKGETPLSWKDGSTLLGKTDKAADSAKLEGKYPWEFATVDLDGRVADSARLDGKLPSAFATVDSDGRVADSAKLDGKDPSAFDPRHYYVSELGPQGSQASDFDGGVATLPVSCDPGDRLVTGGVIIAGEGLFKASVPTGGTKDPNTPGGRNKYDDPTGWLGAVDPDPGVGPWFVYAMCANTDTTS